MYQASAGAAKGLGKRKGRRVRDLVTRAIMIRPKLFLDTNICINAANGNIPAYEWRRVRKHIGGNFRYQISFVTMKELFGKLARCADKYFEENKKPLNILFGPGRRQFLPYPSVFALRTVLGLGSVSRKSGDLNVGDEELAEFEITAVIDARTKAQLKAGIPSRNDSKRIKTFGCGYFRTTGRTASQNPKQFDTVTALLKADRSLNV